MKHHCSRRKNIAHQSRRTERNFDGDIEMTTRNLTADMIDKIQVVDEKIGYG